MRLAERVAKYTAADHAPGACWEWTGYRDRDGYGRINIKGTPRLAHQVAWEMDFGPVPEGLELDHTCDNRACVMVLHLEPVTHAENMRRTRSPVCAQGHTRNPDERECMICQRERCRRNSAARYARKKAAA